MVRGIKIDKVYFEGKTEYQQVQIFSSPSLGKVLFLDRKLQSAQIDERTYHEALVHPVLITHPAPETVLVIGGGDGGALKEVLRYPVQDVVLVEVDPVVIEVSKRYFPWLSTCLEDKRVNLEVMDGREFIQKEQKQFDVVLIDSSEPVGPSLSLHQEAFYRGLKKCLDSQGVAVAQVGSPFYHLEAVVQEYAVLKDIFNFVCVYLAPVPTYPGGSWCYVFLSEKIDSMEVNRTPPPGLKYFDLEIYRAAFCLPPFIKDRLKQESILKKTKP